MTDAIVDPSDPAREPDKGITQAYVNSILSALNEPDVLSILNQVQQRGGSEYTRLRTAILSGVGWGAQIAHTNLFPGLEDAIDQLRDSVLRLDKVIAQDLPPAVLAELIDIRNLMAETVHENVEKETQEEKLDLVKAFYMLPSEGAYTGADPVSDMDDDTLMRTVTPILLRNHTCISAYLLLHERKDMPCMCPSCCMEEYNKTPAIVRIESQLAAFSEMPPGSAKATAFMRKFLTWWYMHAQRSYARALDEIDAELPTLVGERESKELVSALLSRVAAGKPNAS